MDLVTALYDFAILSQKIILIIGLFSVMKIWKTPAFPLIIYLLMVVGVEYFAGPMQNDQWLYNLLGFSELFIFAYIFYKYAIENISKKIILSSLFVCLGFLFVDLIFLSGGIYVYLSYGFGFMSLGISIMCFAYLFEMTKTEKVINHHRIMAYWMSIGLLVFHLCNLPITVLINKLPEIGNIDMLLSIQSISSIIMNGSFAIGFIWSKRKYNI